MDIGQRVIPRDGRKLSGVIVERFDNQPPHLPVVAVIWDGDKHRVRRWFPAKQLLVVQVARDYPADGSFGFCHAGCPAEKAEVISEVEPERWLRTHHKEAAVVGTILAAVAYYRDQPVEWLGALAVFLSFMHAQIAFRFSESDQRQPIAQVPCSWKAQYYFMAKEACWFIYFICLGAWPALIGVVVFLLYPIWRQYHLKRKLNAHA